MNESQKAALTAIRSKIGAFLRRGEEPWADDGGWGFMGELATVLDDNETALADARLALRDLIHPDGGIPDWCVCKECGLASPFPGIESGFVFGPCYRCLSAQVARLTEERDRYREQADAMQDCADRADAKVLQQREDIWRLMAFLRQPHPHKHRRPCENCALLAELKEKYGDA